MKYHIQLPPQHRPLSSGEVDWEVGQELVVVTTAWTDEASNHQNEVRTITAVNGQWLDVGIRDHLLSSSFQI